MEEAIRRKEEAERTEKDNFAAREAERKRREDEKEKLAAEEAAERERLKEQRRLAEERSREAIRKARERQEQLAKERLRKQMAEEAEKRAFEAAKERAEKERLRMLREAEAEKRTLEAAIRAKEEQRKAAEERLAYLRISEKQEVIRNQWARLREQAESREAKSTTTQNEPKTDQCMSSGDIECIHPPFGWPRRNGTVNCNFCGKTCFKYSFRCPNCNISACQHCKPRQGIF